MRRFPQPDRDYEAEAMAALRGVLLHREYRSTLLSITTVPTRSGARFRLTDHLSGYSKTLVDVDNSALENVTMALLDELRAWLSAVPKRAAVQELRRVPLRRVAGGGR